MLVTVFSSVKWMNNLLMVAIMIKFGNIYKYTAEKRKPFTLSCWLGT